MPINATPFYHGHTRNIIIAFGTLFNNISVVRDDGKVIVVPLQYAGKEKWYNRNTQDPSVKKMVSMVLPRMGFFINDFRYDSSRKLNPLGQVTGLNPLTNTSVKSVFNSAPYVISFNLLLWSKTMTDALQVIEQIVPYFTPDFNLTLVELDDPEVKRDIVITLAQVTINDDTAEGGLDETRLIEVSFGFTVEANYFGAVTNKSIIREVIINHRLDWTHPEVVTVRLTGTPDPINADVDDSWVFHEEWEENPLV